MRGSIPLQWSLIAVLASASHAAAETADSGAPTTAVGEIVVTAQRRSETLQKVPASITAVDANVIRTARIEGALDLQRVAPSVNVSTYFGAVQINIRGLGLTSPNPDGETSVLTYVDGVYIARPTAIGAAFEDLSRIEILRGPQGTLYGRNATGGVVNLLTTTPGDVFAGNLSATYGANNLAKVTGGLDTPLNADTLNRIALYYESRDGDQTNLYTGKRVRDIHAYGVRDTLLAHVNDRLTLTLRADYYQDKHRGANYDLLEGTESAGANPFGSIPSNPSGYFPQVTTGPAATPRPNNGVDVSFNAPSPDDGHQNWGTSLTADWKLTDQISLKSITAFRSSYYFRDRQDYDGSDASIIEENFAREQARQVTQEFDLGGGDRFNWVVGTFFFHEYTHLNYEYTLPAYALLYDYILTLPPGALPNTLNFHQTGTTGSISAFGQATYKLTDKLSLTGGVRENYDTKDQLQDIIEFGGNVCGGPAASSGDWSSFTWKGGLQYSITPENLVYVTVSKGFKAGGLNLSACDAKYSPEDVISYEVGTKNTFFQGRLLANISAFYYDYTNLQVNVFTAVSTLTQNSSSADVYGAEFESKFKPVEPLEIGGNFSVLHSVYEGYHSINPLDVGSGGAPIDLSGYQIANTSKFLAQGYVAYTVPVGVNSVQLRYDVRYNSGWWGDAFHNEGTFQPAYTVHNVRASYLWSRYEVGAFVDNLANQLYADNRFAFGSTGGVLAIWAPLRTWGIFANAKF